MNPIPIVIATGHAEIDEQHAILAAMIEEVSILCHESKHNPNAICSNCAALTQQCCTSKLKSIISKLGAFLRGHTTYEEKMMELLPNTPECLAHIEKHTASHQSIFTQLKKLPNRVLREPPRIINAEIIEVAVKWLADHTATFDLPLAQQLDSTFPGVGFDGELVSMLDKHVFPDRPTKMRFSPDPPEGFREKKMESRGRYESLSPSQRAVFWLVASGIKNSDIAKELRISINTVKTHRTMVFQKMEVKSVLELVKKADLLR
ncbi:MAG: LuxR C-terminal-related transcriptional regulator [Betaproteobacteria bacterium]